MALFSLREPGGHPWPRFSLLLLAPATVIAIAFVIVPLLFVEAPGRFIRTSCAVSCVLFLAYLFTLLRPFSTVSINKARLWSSLTEPVPEDVLESQKRKFKEAVAGAIAGSMVVSICSSIVAGLLLQEWSVFGLGLGIGLLWYAAARFKHFRRR